MFFFQSIGYSHLHQLQLNCYLFHQASPIQDVHFWGCSRIEGGGGGGCKKATLPKICHTYPKMMKVGTVVPYLKKIQKICKSRDTLLKFC